MKHIIFDNLTWDGNCLIIYFDQISLNEIIIKQLDLKFVKRKTKETIALKYDKDALSRNKSIAIDISALELDSNEEEVIYDLIFSTNKSEFKLAKKGSVIKEKQLRYFEPIYQVNQLSGVIPYLTSNNEIALLCSSVRDIKYKFYHISKKYKEIDHVQIENDHMELTFSNVTLESYEKFHLICADKAQNRSFFLEHQIIENNNEVKIIIDLKNQTFWEFGKKYRLFIEATYKKSIIQIHLGLFGNNQRFFDKVRLTDKYDLLPYLDSKDQICFFIVNEKLEERAKYEIIEKKLEVEEFSLQNGVLHIKIDPESYTFTPDPFEEMSWELIKLTLLNGDNHSSYDFDLVDGFDITLNFNQLLQEEPNEISHWKCYLKFYYHDVIYNVLLLHGTNGVERYADFTPLSNGKYLVKHISEKNVVSLVLTKDLDSVKELTLPNLKGLTPIKNIKMNHNLISFVIFEEAFDFSKKYKFIAVNQDSDETFSLKNVKIKQKEIEIDFSSFIEKYGNVQSKWYILLKVIHGAFIELNHFAVVENSVLPKFKRYLGPFKHEGDYQISPYLTDENKLAIFIDKEEAINKEKIPTKTKKSKLTVSNVKVTGEKLTFKVEFNHHQRIPGKVSFYLSNRKTGDPFYINAKEYQDNIYELDFHEFIDIFDDKYSRWNLFSEVVYDDFVEVARVGEFGHTESKKYKKYYDCFSIGEKNSVSAYLTNKNEISLVVRDKRYYFTEKYEVKSLLNNLSMKGSMITGEVTLKVPYFDDYLLDDFTMKLRSQVEDEEHSIEFTQSNVIKNESKISFRIDLTKHQLKQFYYEFYLVLKINGEIVYKRVENSTESLMKKINNSVISNNYINEDKCVIYPYITPKEVLFLAYRQMGADESSKDQINELIAYPLYSLFKSYYDKKDIWLVYEKNSETAQDNSFYFFKYCYENHYDKNIYYVIKKNSPDYKNLKGMEDRVIDFMSIKHLVYLCAAKLLVASETRGHLYLWRHQKGKIKDILNGKKFVFLQHGVTALKLNDNTLAKSSASAVNLYVVTSEFERDVISNGLGYDKDEIIVTGFTRWDYLRDKSHETNPKEIFLMPTWRGWLDEIPEEEFVNTPYFKNYMEVLNSKKLHKILQDQNLKLNFFIHPKFKQYISNFTATSNNIRIISFGEEKVNELLMSTSLLITDYSSVAWEVYYLKKPVIFFQFDIEDYNRLTGSYIDMDEGLFGDRVFNSIDLINTIEHYVENNFSEKEAFASERSNYFKYIDNNNSERVYNGIVNSKVLFGKNNGKSKKLTKNYAEFRKNKLIVTVWNASKKNKLTRSVAVKGKNMIKRLTGNK
ncbi:CDP-glycerol glycerophosphotransferase family protein [Bacillus sp. AFS076308]|uniref:CDP-glycerol glycerophosphotransferase family protein n=1 Tax=Bacillus sp. AFS076308 TaxID=2033512 RepID=UPI0015969357|nr:CDP-glycerol glycerophosphotransferase family protein [Bacillus sp. AFS076308]